jgi:hypothetical protein
MRIKKSAVEESERLTDGLEAAQKHSNKKEIEVIEEKILEVHEEYRKHEVLHHSHEMSELRNKKDILFGQISNLERIRATTIEERSITWEKYHVFFRQQFIEELQNGFYRKVERGKRFVSIDRMQSNVMGVPIFKIQTNLLDSVRGLKVVSMEIEWFSKTRTSLAVQLDRLEKFQKDFSFDFKMLSIDLMGDGELLNFRTFFPSKTEIEDSKWQPTVLSPDVLGRQFNAIINWFEPKQIKLS